MKKIFLVLILIFSLSFFVGCGQTGEITIGDDYIMLSLEERSDGKIVQSMRFSLNNKKINGIALSLKEELDFRRNLIKQVSEIRNEFLFGFALTFISNPCDEYKINQGVILSEVTYNENNDTIGFDIYFTSAGAWNYYHKKDPADDKKPSQNGNIFYKRSVSKGLFPFASKTKIQEEEIMIGKVYKNRYLAAAKGLSFEANLKEDYRPCYVYNYSTPLSRIKSNANLVFRGIDRNYNHLWVVEDDNLCDQNTLSLSLTFIYRGWWIFFATFLPLSVCAIAILTVVLRKKNKDKNIDQNLRKNKKIIKHKKKTNKNGI